MSTREMLDARRSADQMRGEYLTLVANGLMKPSDVIVWATEAGKEPLRALTLKRLLGVIPGNGEQTVSRFLRELAAVVRETRISPSRLTVAWLVDRRAGGRRLVAFANLSAAPALPWAGFPHAPKPEGGR